MATVLVICVAVLFSGALSENDGSGEPSAVPYQYVNAALDGSSGAVAKVNTRDMDELPKNEIQSEEKAIEEEARYLDDDSNANFEEDSYAEENIEERGLEDTRSEEKIDDVPPQENIEEARSFKDSQEQKPLEEKYMEEDMDARSTDDDRETRSMEEMADEMEARELEGADDEEMEARELEGADVEEMEARELEGADGKYSDDALESAEEAGDEISRESKKRSLYGLSSIVGRQVGWRNSSRLLLLNYGCYCGVWRRGRTVMDKVDRCCQRHRYCYSKWTSGWLWTRRCPFSFWTQPYRFQCKGSKCTCKSHARSCAGRACKCDLDFGKCLKANWKSYNPKNRRRCTYYG